MSGERTLVLKLVTDAASAQKGAKQAESGLSKLGSTVKGLGVGLGIGLGLNQAMDVMGDAIDKASDLAEQQGKVGAVFGESADAVRAWARDLDHSYGITETAALAAAGNIGNLTQSMGLSNDVASTMSEQIVQLAGDLSSFNNVPVEEVLGALQSGLIGEAEPMRKFGVLLSDAAVQAEALASGLAPTKAAITDAVKVQARYNIILRQTSKAQGDAARTVDTYAGKQRAMSVVIDEAQVSLGAFLKEGIDPVIGAFAQLIDQAPNVGTTVGRATAQMREDIAKLNEEKATDKDLIEQIIEGPGALGEQLARLAAPQDAAIHDYVMAHMELVDQLQVSKREIGLFIEAALASGKTWEQIDVMFRDIRVQDFTSQWIAGLRTMASQTSSSTGSMVDDLGTVDDAVAQLPATVAQALVDTTFALKDPAWRDGWQTLADWAWGPFMALPKRIKRMAERAAGNASKAADDHRGRAAARWSLLADVMTDPLFTRLLELNHSVEYTTAKVLELRALDKELGPVSVVVTGAGRSADNTFVTPETPAQRRARIRRERNLLRRLNQGGGRGAGGGAGPGSGVNMSAVASDAYGATWAPAGFGWTASRNAAEAHYTVNVNATAADPYTVGQAVVRAIKAYESREGKRWRSSSG